jgi:hypothetical protein
VFKLLTKAETWQTIPKGNIKTPRYYHRVIWKPGDSHFWAGLMAAKKFFFRLDKNIH